MAAPAPGGKLEALAGRSFDGQFANGMLRKLGVLRAADMPRARAISVGR